MGIEHFHVSKAGAAFRHGTAATAKAKRDSTTPDASCATGSFYSAPALGSSVPASSPISVVWATQLSCLQPAPSNVDILLYGLGDSTPVMHTWSGVPYSTGGYNITLQPTWWNSTANKQLQLMIVPSGTPAYLNTLPAGPVFTATFAADSTAAVAADAALPTSGTTTYVSGAPLSGVSQHKLSSGKKAAAVLLPLLFVILCSLAYLKVKRSRGQAKRSAWSEKLDKRMSTISADWKSITPGGAKEAVRQSMAASRPSNVSFSFGAGAITTGAVEGEPVVMGEKTRGGSIEISEKDLPRTTLGAGVGVGVGARRPRTHATPPDRTSRAVSFADSAHPRPSTGSRPYSRGSRAFHTAAYAVNTFSSFPSSGYSSTAVSSPDLSGATSPRQTAGPLTLTPEDIRRRMTTQHGQEGWRQSVDEVFGALSRESRGDLTGQEALRSTVRLDLTVSTHEASGPASSYNSSPGPAFVTPAAVSTPTTASSASPFAMPMQPPTMSPDAMLRAYAAKHASVVGSLKDAGMRVLYKPEDDANPARAASPALIRAGPGARISR
ncbi:hypothetical protein C8R45DRAFT_816727 [Mycena sanguinolenta]|nr:hypothetical protein C8R45DRAFT_816727 [Mycena sanguinolenta]